jgi:hypothetical protein
MGGLIVRHGPRADVAEHQRDDGDRCEESRKPKKLDELRLQRGRLRCVGRRFPLRRDRAKARRTSAARFDWRFVA